jgi:hypothetical protein
VKLKREGTKQYLLSKENYAIAKVKQCLVGHTYFKNQY